MKIFLKVLPYALVALMLFLLGSWIYNSGSTHGASVVQAKWDKQKKSDADAIQALKDEYDAKEESHRNENREITHELAEAQKSHEVALAEQRAEYDRRLQLSSERAAIYQRKAEGGAVECRSLASYATQLDTTLEEGRSLVRELRQTLGLREQQLTLLGNQIKNDRALFEDGK